MDEKKFLDIFKALGKYAEVVGSAFLTNFSATEIEKQIKNYEDKALEVTRAFGIGRDRIVELKASMADAVVSVTQMGGSLADVAAITKDVGSALNRNMILTSESYSKLYAASKITGLGYKELTNLAKDAGMSVYQISENMKKVVDIASASGINAKTVSSEVQTNIGLLDKYNFTGGIEGLAKMATQAANLRITVKDIQGAMTRAFEPQTAIDMAAALQRLGMSQSSLLDPLRLMDLAQNDPAELQNQIAEMSKTFVEFNDKTKSFQIAPGAKRQLQEVATALGMQPEAFAKMAKSAAEMDDKLKKISFPNTFTEDQKKFVANMAEMGEGGEYMLRVKGEDLKLDEAMVKIQSMSEEERKKFFDSQKEKSIEQLAEEQLTVSEKTAANIKSIANRIGAAVASSETQEMANKANIELSQAIPKLMSGEKLQVPSLREAGDKVTQELIQGIQKGDIVGSLVKAEGESKKYLNSAFDEVLVGAKTAFTDLGKSSNPLINIMSTLATKTGEFIVKQEGLGTGLSNLTTTVNNTNKAIAPTEVTTSGNKEINKTLETPKTQTEVSKNEFKFTEPLKIEISLTGAEGLTKEQLENMIKEDKLNQVILTAVEKAMKEKLGK